MKRLLAVSLAALIAVGCGAEDATDGATQSAVLRFSAIPDKGQTELKEKFDKVAEHLSQELGVEVEYVSADDYQASVEYFKNGDIHLAWFGGLTGVQARNAVAGSRAIVQGVEDPNYYSYFIAHESLGLARSDDFPAALEGVAFSFGSESSTSGRLMPEFFVRQNSGKSPKEFFGSVAYSGSHPNTVKAVNAGTAVKAGVLNYKVFDAMKAAGEADACVIVWKTPFYADYNMTAHPDLETMFGAGFTDKLQNALGGIEDPELLSAFQRDALIPATNEEFDAIAKTAVELGLQN
jgi:phosphonate transport system substrate-binding protein